MGWPSDWPFSRPILALFVAKTAQHKAKYISLEGGDKSKQAQNSPNMLLSLSQRVQDDFWKTTMMILLGVISMVAGPQPHPMAWPSTGSWAYSWALLRGGTHLIGRAEGHRKKAIWVIQFKIWLLFCFGFGASLMKPAHSPKQPPTEQNRQSEAHSGILCGPRGVWCESGRLQSVLDQAEGPSDAPGDHSWPFCVVIPWNPKFWPPGEEQKFDGS